jgi:hypothetical protein
MCLKGELLLFVLLLNELFGNKQVNTYAVFGKIPTVFTLNKKLPEIIRKFILILIAVFLNPNTIP